MLTAFHMRIDYSIDFQPQEVEQLIEVGFSLIQRLGLTLPGDMPMPKTEPTVEPDSGPEEGARFDFPRCP